MIWSICYLINVIEFGHWSCGLCQRTLKSWHILKFFRKICGFRAGNSDDLYNVLFVFVYFYNFYFPTCSFFQLGLAGTWN